jgi:hypothetical protein
MIQFKKWSHLRGLPLHTAYYSWILSVQSNRNHYFRLFLERAMFRSLVVPPASLACTYLVNMETQHFLYFSRKSTRYRFSLTCLVDAKYVWIVHYFFGLSSYRPENTVSNIQNQRRCQFVSHRQHVFSPYTGLHADYLRTFVLFKLKSECVDKF